MKGLSTTLLIICLIIFSLNYKENIICLENSPLNGAVSVYYDSNGNKCVHVKSYTKKNGTHVEDYYRSFPSKNKLNNQST